MVGFSPVVGAWSMGGTFRVSSDATQVPHVHVPKVILLGLVVLHHGSGVTGVDLCLVCGCGEPTSKGQWQCEFTGLVVQVSHTGWIVLPLGSAGVTSKQACILNGNDGGSLIVCACWGTTR